MSEIIDVIVDLIKDTLIDGVKLLPFLFITFLLMELIEHKFGDKLNKILAKVNKIGPLFGSLLGIIPQCGISASASNFYITRVISLGTLISVYLSTSDEMLPILISENAPIPMIVKLLAIKFVCGIIFGFVIDFLTRKRTKEDIKDFCELEDCDCDHGVIKSSIIHTLKIALYIFIATILIGSLIYFIGEDSIKNILKHGNILTYFLASLIGLIPNCASSVIITELYLNSMISLGTLLSGTLTGAGVGLLILFKENKHIKENLMIVSIIYFIGVLIGFLIDLIGIVF